MAEARRLALLRRNRARLAWASLPSLIALALCVLALVTGGTGWWVLGLMIAPIGLLALASVARQNPDPVRRDGVVRVDPRGVHVDGRLEVPRSEVRSAFVVPYFAAPPRLRLIRRGLRPTVEIEAVDLGAAREALQELELDASRTVLGLDTPSLAVGRKWVGALMLFAGVTVALNFGGAAALWTLIALSVVQRALRLVPSHLDIGLDGVAVRWLLYRRVFRYEELARVDVFHEPGQRSSGLRFTHVDGTRHEIRLTFKEQDHARTTAAYERISEAVEAYRRNFRGHVGLGLERGDRSIAEWLAALKRVGSGASATHRTAPIDVERLVELVEDAAARPSARVAAAIALRGAADGASLERVRVAAAASITPSVRVALERATSASDDDAALEEALAAVDAEEGRRARPVR